MRCSRLEKSDFRARYCTLGSCTTLWTFQDSFFPSFEYCCCFCKLWVHLPNREVERCKSRVRGWHFYRDIYKALVEVQTFGLESSLTNSFKPRLDFFDCLKFLHTRLSKTIQDNSRQSKTIQYYPRQSKTKPCQSKTKQEIQVRPRQSKTIQDNPRQINLWKVKPRPSSLATLPINVSGFATCWFFSTVSRDWWP